MPWGQALRETRQRMEVMRRFVGEDVDIALDPHAQIFEPIKAQEMAEVVKPFRPMFYEEPLRPENIAAMGRLHQKIDIPLATGEMLVTKYQFRDLIAANAADILQPDLLLCGGLLEAKKIAAMAEADVRSFVYSSSAAVYGDAEGWSETPACERPLNVYAFSKWLFDQHVRRAIAAGVPNVVGLRYFNVYGPGEQHKGSMASIVRTFALQLSDAGVVRPFGASHGLGPGEQERDFVHVDDVVDVVLWAASSPEVRGIFNCGTGTARSFNDVASLVIEHLGSGSVQYTPFPVDLVPRYQARTVADLSRLRAAGYEGAFAPLEVGVPRYLDQLSAP